MVSIAIAYHSGYGHTAKVAHAVAEGAKKTAGVTVIAVDKIDDAAWAALDNADAIIFGAPTYMGGVSAPFKTFIDAASSRWMKQAWKDKIAAGFTNSASYSGDKLNTLFQLSVNAAQHGMIWVGNAIMPTGGYKGTDSPKHTDINRVGSYLGLMTQANNDSPEITPPQGDIETARMFGERVASITAKFRR